MKNLLIALTLFAASLAQLSAQVKVEILQTQDQFLPGESLPTAVRITNRSGQTLHLGSDEDWLTFSMDARDGSVVAQTGDAPVLGEFTLASSKMATKRVDLAPYFSLTRPGRYSIIATVKIKGWDNAIVSLPKDFDIIEGARLWEQAVGIPKTSAENAAPEVRKYVLQQANYIKGQIRLFLRVTDSSGSKTFRVLPIGSMVSFSRPEPQVDKFSNLHVLYQNGPHSFSYSVFNPEGELLAHDTYDMARDAHLRLQADADGKISVAGGIRRMTSDEQSAPKLAAPRDDAQKPKP
jgi:hypothetical protein